MELFKKRETLVQNIAYMAIMAAINVIFVLLSSLLPVLLFILVFILPLTSTIVTLLCKKRYFPIYFVVTLSLCFAVSAGFSVFDTFIYVLPSLITGFIFGFCIEKRIAAIYSIVVATIVQYGLTVLTFFVIGRIVTNLNLTESIIVAFGLGDYEFKAVFTQVFLFIISEIQILISYIVVRYQVSKLGFDVNLICRYKYIIYLTELGLLVLTILSYFYFPTFTIVLTLISLNIYVYQVIDLCLKKRIWIWISIAGAHLFFLFFFAFLFQYTVAPNQFILFYILFGLLTIIDFLGNYCFKRNRNKLE